MLSFSNFINFLAFPSAMAFSRRFPRDVKGSPYPTWEEVYLSDQEEQGLETEQHEENLKLMRECLADAKKLFSESQLKDFQSDIVDVAIALFEKRASHSVYWKEEATKEKFDRAYRKV